MTIEEKNCLITAKVVFPKFEFNKYIRLNLDLIKRLNDRHLKGGKK